MSHPRPDVSVIVVSWNTRQYTLACLASLPDAAARVRWDAWVVDNASDDDSVAAIRRDHPQVRVIANMANVGFAAANNQGIVACAGRYVLLLNSDTVMAPGALDALVAFADAHPRAGVVGPTLLNPDGSYQTGPTPFPSVWTETMSVTGLGRRLTYRGYPSLPARRARASRRADYVGGACMLVRREAIAAVGLLDESYFMYSEEPDWCWRMHRAGWETWYTPDASVTHFGGQSTRQARDAMVVALYRSKVRFLYLNRGRGSALCTAAVVVAVTHLRRAVRRAARLEPPGVAMRLADLWPEQSAAR
jgi:GT2 family glycosyltransferase